MTIFLTVIQVICGIVLIGIIMMQSGKRAGLCGSIAGVADSFMSKHEAKTADAKMAKATKWIGAVFIVLTLILNILARKNQETTLRCRSGSFFCIARTRGCRRDVFILRRPWRKSNKIKTNVCILEKDMVYWMQLLHGTEAPL